jgi:HAD superfamily hydrolase (TIGR01490 family)
VQVEPGAYRACTYSVEADASSAVYPLAAAAAVGGRVRVDGLGAGSMQADARFADVLATMGATVERGQDYTEVRGSGALRGVDVDLRDFSDCAPTVAVLAALAQTPTSVTGIGFIRSKESDRIDDVVGELRRCGADATAEPDGFTVRPAALHGATVRTHHDHRVAMSFAVLGLVVPGVEIEDPDVVTKSYPDFWAMLDQVRRSGAPVAAFDVDGTLTTRDSVVPYLRRVAGATRLALSVARHPLLAVTTAIGRGDRDRLKEAVVGPLVRGRRREELDEIGARYAHDVLAHRTRADTVARLAWHRAQGHRVVLVSASLRSYLEPFARDVLGGVDAVLCTDLEVDADGVCTGRLAGRNCRGPEKVRRLAAWLGTDGRVAWAYGDSSGDAELLAAAACPVRVGATSLSTVPDREPT